MEVNEKVLKVITGKLVSFLNEEQMKEFEEWLKEMNICLDGMFSE